LSSAIARRPRISTAGSDPTEIYNRWFASQKGFSVGAAAAWKKHGLWNKDPVMLPFRSAARSGRFVGYAGPSDRNATEVLTKYILTDMDAKGVQGMPAAEAVKKGGWADRQDPRASPAPARLGQAAGLAKRTRLHGYPLCCRN
jgi:hypothetical protein